MREIKFRAWDKFQKKYVFEGFHVIGEVTVFGGIDAVISETFAQRRKSTLESYNDFVLEQFTGLHDKNGKKIYESDIVERKIFNGAEPKCIVEWDNKNPGFDFLGIKDGEIIYALGKTHSEWEVIGNIYENPELLK